MILRCNRDALRALGIALAAAAESGKSSDVFELTLVSNETCVAAAMHTADGRHVSTKLFGPGDAAIIDK